MRTQEQILADVMAGHLDISDVKVAYRVQIDEIDKSGDDPKLVRSRVYIDGKQTEVIQYG